MILLCECEWIFSYFLRFCAGTREYFLEDPSKNRIVDEKNFGESRTGGAVASLRDPKRNLAQNYFPATRRPPEKIFQTAKAPEKISQTAMRIVRGRLLDPVPPPPPGKWAPDPRPAAVRECKRVVGFLPRCGSWSLRGGPWSPATAYAWKQCCEQVCAIS